MHRWYLLQTKARAEYQALAQLQAQGYEAFLPQIDVERVRQGRLQRVTEAMFARYLFLRLDDDRAARSWAPIRSTRGVSSLVRFGQSYAQVPEEVVTWLQETPPPLISQAFTPGQNLTIIEGPFSGFSAIFAAYEGLERAAVFLDLLAKQQRAVFPLSNLRAVDEPTRPLFGVPHGVPHGAQAAQGAKEAKET